ncbi:NfeD family protein [Salinibacterium sp. dk2585]|uniref:NfeD family protein n=1 Tax=unclassified Salinibacterium TaxID=2632331 RepID=UPI0011C24BED|nr:MULTISPECIES: NfeD family protein [unclassified Salinibacterium]QEE61148.1 NfeD family protein [Salinibacterium sp. dk2585]TXK53091.1 NfeD family protein [Salinibacterium sp. dk5596]
MDVLFVDLTQYIWIVWLVFILIAVIIELITLEFTFLMIAAGSLGGLGANLLGAPWWVQIAVAAILSVLLILLIRPVLLRRLRRGEDTTPSNIDALMGMDGRVVIAIGDSPGQVKLANGEVWTSRLSALTEHRVVAEGERVVVTAIEGSTAVVVPVERNQG